MLPKTAAHLFAVEEPAETPFYIAATQQTATRPPRALKYGDTLHRARQPRRYFGVVGRLGRPVPSRHPLSVAARIAGQRRPAAAARLQPARRQFGASSVDLTNPDLMADQRIVLEKDTVHILRTMFLWRGTAYQRLGVRNYGDRAVDLRISILFENDFADLFEVRGAHREHRGTATAKLRGNDQVLLIYRGLDDKVRRTTLTFDPPPNRLTTSAAVYELHLEPGEMRPLFLAVSCDAGRRAPAAVPGAASSPRAANCARRPGSDLGRDLERAFQRDAVPLGRRSRHADDRYAARPLSLCRHPVVLDHVRPRRPDHRAADAVVEPGRRARRAAAARRLSGQDHRSARRCGAGKNPARDARRRDGGAARGAVRALLRQRRFDAAVRPAGRTLCRSAPATSKPSAELWPAIEAALGWIDGPGDPDGDGFVEYAARQRAGAGQSGLEGFPRRDLPRRRPAGGRPDRARRGAGLRLRRQAHGGALRAAARDATPWRDKLDAEATRLAERFESAFWCPEIETYALALDGAKKPCRVRTSNAGQVLFTGIAAPERAARVANGLLQTDFFSGWGIRTVARGEARYNPMSYHNGSIWPHDNALIALGLRALWAQAGGRDAVRGPVRRRALTWITAGCRNCSAASSASTATGRRSIRSPARRRPGPAPRRSRCSKPRSGLNSIRSRAKSGCAIRACRRFSTR